MADTFETLAGILLPRYLASVRGGDTLESLGWRRNRNRLRRTIEQMFDVEFEPGTVLRAELTVDQLVQMIEDLRDDE